MQEAAQSISKMCPLVHGHYLQLALVTERGALHPGCPTAYSNSPTYCPVVFFYCVNAVSYVVTSFWLSASTNWLDDVCGLA